MEMLKKPCMCSLGCLKAYGGEKLGGRLGRGRCRGRGRRRMGRRGMVRV
jgi:hypothetical protein